MIYFHCVNNHVIHQMRLLIKMIMSVLKWNRLKSQAPNFWNLITQARLHVEGLVMLCRWYLCSCSREGGETLKCTLVPQGHLLVLLKDFTLVFLWNRTSRSLISDIHRLSETSHIITHKHTHRHSQNPIVTSCLSHSSVFTSSSNNNMPLLGFLTIFVQMNKCHVS